MPFSRVTRCCRKVWAGPLSLHIPERADKIGERLPIDARRRIGELFLGPGKFHAAVFGIAVQQLEGFQCPCLESRQQGDIVLKRHIGKRGEGLAVFDDELGLVEPKDKGKAADEAAVLPQSRLVGSPRVILRAQNIGIRKPGKTVDVLLLVPDRGETGFRFHGPCFAVLGNRQERCKMRRSGLDREVEIERTKKDDLRVTITL